MWQWHKQSVVVAILLKRDRLIMSFFRHSLLYISLFYSLWIMPSFAFDVRVGVLALPPLVMNNKSAFEQGLVIDILKLIAEQEKWHLSFRTYSYTDGMAALYQREIQIFVGVSKTQAQREVAYLQLSEQTIVENWGQFYQHKDQIIREYSDLTQKHIGILSGYGYTDALHSVCSGLQLDCELSNFNKIDALLNSLNKGDIQVALLPRLQSAAYEQQYPSNTIQRSTLLLNAYSLYIAAAAKQNGHILDSIDQYLYKWRIQKDPLYQQVQAQWLGKITVLKQISPTYWHWLAHIFVVFIAIIVAYGYLSRLKQQQIQTRDKRLLQQRETLYRNLVETMPYGLEELDLKGQIVFCNQADQRIRRYHAHELIGQSIISMIVSDEQQGLFSTHLNHLIEKKPVFPEPFYLTISRKDGLSADVRTDISYKYDIEGNLVGFFSTITDITGMKETKERIKNYHLELKRLADERRKELRSVYNDLLVTTAVFENTTEAIMVLTLDGKFSATNPAFSQITGYSGNSIKGQPFGILVAKNKKQDTEFSHKLWQALQTKGQWQNELWAQRADGSTYPAWVSLNEVEDAKNHTTQYVALLSDITRRKQYEKQIWRQANYDALTNLPNRHLFHRRMQQALAEAEQKQQNMVLMFIDLDHFKEVNDSMGHDAGDELLKAATQRIRNTVRPQDTIARMGGDEFTVILPSPIQKTETTTIAETIVQTLSETFSLSEGKTHISASIGIVCYPEHGDNVSSLLKNADIAMYQVKQQGRCAYGIFTPEESN